MNDALPELRADIHSRVRRELIDSFDEELELELDDHFAPGATEPDDAAFRNRYFRLRKRLIRKDFPLIRRAVTKRHRAVMPL